MHMWFHAQLNQKILKKTPSLIFHLLDSQWGQVRSQNVQQVISKEVVQRYKVYIYLKYYI